MNIARGLYALLVLVPMTRARAQSAALDPVPGTTPVLVQLAAGVVPRELPAIEAALRQGGDVRVQLSRRSAERAITELGFQLRGTGPALVATTGDPGLLLLVNVAARDTAAVLRSITAVDAARRRLAVRNLPPPILLAEALLWLGDSSAARSQLAEFERNAPAMAGDVLWGMVRNDWLTGRAFRLLADLREHRAPARDTARWQLRAAVGAEAVTRYDAVMWAALPGAPPGDTGKVIARLTAAAAECGLRQRFGVLDVDLPLRGLLDLDDVVLRRQIHDALRDLTTETLADDDGRVLRRDVRSAAPLPDELRSALEDGLMLAPLAAVVPLPRRAVAVGDTWRDSVRLWAPGGLFDQNQQAEATLRLERVVQAGDQRLAFIALDARVTGAVRATLSGEAVLDVDSGEFLRLAASLRAQVTAGPSVRVLYTALRDPVTAPLSVAFGASAPAADAALPR